VSLNLEQKQAVVAEVSKVVSDAKAAILAEYRGLTVAQMTDLRRKANKDGVYVCAWSRTRWCAVRSAVLPMSA
jgi:large subunit ribosomal protein L10